MPWVLLVCGSTVLLMAVGCYIADILLVYVTSNKG